MANRKQNRQTSRQTPLPDKFERMAFAKMLLDKHKLSIGPTHKEFGFNGIRFSIHIFNTENEIDFATEVLHKELA